MPELPWIFTRLDLRALIDIFSVALIFFWVLWVAQGTRAMQLIRGLAILIIVVVGVANIFDLTALKWLLSRAFPALIIAIPVVFQPELRRALEQLGHTGSWLRPPFMQSETDLEHTVDVITRASAQLARHRYGALIVIERETGLQEYVDRGVPLDATLTLPLLINIFFPNSPLHDGAVIVRYDRVLAASAVLPLSENVATGGQLGTRHRAGMGITEESDAIAVIVSEETGQISVANSGRLYRNLDPERLRKILRTLLRLDRSERPSARPPRPERAPSSGEGRDHGRVDGVERVAEDTSRTPTRVD